MMISVTTAAAASVMVAASLPQGQTTGQTCTPKLDPLDRQNYRLREAFYFRELPGEKEVENEDNCQFHLLRFGEPVTAGSILQLNVRDDPTVERDLRHRGYNLILIPEIRRAEDAGWERIEAPNRYYRKIRALQAEPIGFDSMPDTFDYPPELNLGADTLEDANGVKGCLRALPEKLDSFPRGLTPRSRPPVFDVTEEGLQRNAHLAENDWVLVLYYYDLLQKYNCPYLRDLRHAAREHLSILTLDLRDLPIVQPGGEVEFYTARDGDQIRLLILSAQQEVRQRDRALQLLKEQRFPDFAAYRATTHVQLEDELAMEVAEYGLRIQIIPSVAYASRTDGDEWQLGRFDPVETTPSLTTVVYPLTYRGRNDTWRAVSTVSPGIFLGVLDLDGDSDTDAKFSIGLAWMIPSLRQWVNLLVGWSDLDDRKPFFGIGLSPKIDIQALIRRDEPGKNE